MGDANRDNLAKRAELKPVEEPAGEKEPVGEAKDPTKLQELVPGKPLDDRIPLAEGPQIDFLQTQKKSPFYSEDFVEVLVYSLDFWAPASKVRVISEWAAHEGKDIPPAFKLCTGHGLSGLQRFLNSFSKSDTVACSINHKVRSSIMYGALGDAIGCKFEEGNKGRTSWNKALGDNRGRPIIHLGDVLLGGDYVSYSDDTGMTMLVIKGILKHGNVIQRENVNPIMGDIAKAYMKEDKDDKIKGWSAGHRVPGGACCQAMGYLRDGAKQGSNNPPWWDVSGNMIDAGGCGTVMRAHPWGLRFYEDPDLAAYLAAQESKITHGADIARGGSAAMAAMVALAVQNKSVDEIVKGGIAAAEKYAPNAKGDIVYSGTESLVGMINAAKKQGAAARELLMAKRSRAFDELVHKFYKKYTGWGADSAVACAVFALMVHPDNPYKAVVMSVNSLGTDADTIASVAGALVGAYTGVPLPSDDVLGAKLEARAELEDLAGELAAWAQAK